jgi:hypothetical protein
MKILTHIKSGALRSVKASKGVLIIWSLSLLLISLVSLPLKSGFKSMVGSSMITELLTHGFNADVFMDMKEGLISLIPVLTTGFLLILLFNFLLNAFFTGGLFTILSSKNTKHTLSDFFAGGASNFWSVLIINIITTLIILLSGSVIGGIPLAIVSSGPGSPEPGAIGKIVRIAVIIMALLLPILLLVADFSRAWQVTHNEKKPFKAIGFGFSMTYRTILLSFPIMLLLVLVQFGFGALVMSKLLASKPVTGGGVLLLFIGSQLLFIFRISLRVWRYGCVTSVMEEKIRSIPDAHDQKVAELWPSI